MAHSCQDNSLVSFSALVVLSSSPPFHTLLPNTQLFPPIFLLPPIHPNTAPCCNMLVQQPSSPHGVTLLNHSAWAHFLADYPDKNFVSSLLQIIEFGANIGFRGVQTAQPSKNLKSALQSLDFVQSSIDNLLANNYAHGPFKSPPLDQFCCSPLGVVFCKWSTSKPCLINHLSWPPGSSVNDGIPDSEASISYDACECAIRNLILASDMIEKEARVQLGEFEINTKINLLLIFPSLVQVRASWKV
jgi:hypothetical protein